MNTAIVITAVAATVVAVGAYAFITILVAYGALIVWILEWGGAPRRHAARIFVTAYAWPWMAANIIRRIARDARATREGIK